ncbi:MAG: helix-turn-helix transcriptional regulator [Proteobacteria bacterium]|nr:helix-turn-helix transcriptional regulator [Pseudomonadota bacterium]
MLGDKLKKTRGKLNLTLRRVQKDTGISNAYLSQIEHGKIKKPSAEMLEKLAVYYKLDISELLSLAGYASKALDLDLSEPKQTIAEKLGIQNALKLVNATHLVHFADRKEAESMLPDLVRQLITASTNFTALDMASGDSVNMSGWDGYLNYQGPSHPFIPQGISLWEMGRTTNKKAKATSDLRKRTQNPLGHDITNATFVFVTPRRWKESAKTKWIDDSRAGTEWKDIRVCSADNLEQWLELSPTVTLWFAEYLGIRQPGSLPLMVAWQEWLASTNPPLNSDLLLKSLPGKPNEVRNFLMTETPGVYRLQSEDSEISLAYLAAIIDAEKWEHRTYYWSRTVVVENKNAFRQLSAQGNQLTLIPTFQGAPIGKATQNGHKVLIPQVQMTDPDYSIQRLPTYEIEKHLTSIGRMPEAKSHRLASSCNGSISILRRLLVNEREVCSVEWCDQTFGPALAPLVLVGGWDHDNESDRKAIAALAGRDYSEIEKLMQTAFKLSLPPVKKVGTTYKFTSQEYAYSLLKDYLHPSALDKFLALLSETISESDPKWDMEKENRYAAAVYGKLLSNSNLLRSGIFSAAALLAVQPPGNVPFFPSKVQSVLSKTFEKQGTSWKSWASLGNNLLPLSEAAPEAFINALEEIVQDSEGDFKDVFLQESSLGGAAHTSLLWALEICAWSKEHFGAIAHLLCQMVPFEDVNSNLVNQPFKTLRGLFSLWNPQTTADLFFRMDTLTGLMTKYPKVAWKLLISLIPKQHEIGFSNHWPQYRDWADSFSGHPPRPDVMKGVQFVSNMILESVEHDSTRWVDVIGRLSEIPSKTRLKLLKMLKSLRTSSLKKEDSISIWNKIQETLCEHREYSEALWALDSSSLDVLEKAYQNFMPEDPIEKWQTIFGSNPHHPKLVRKDPDYSKRYELLRTLRIEAVDEVYTKLKLEGIVTLCEQSYSPRLIGNATAGLSQLKGREREVIFGVEFNAQLNLEGDFSSKGLFFLGFVAKRFDDEGIDWAKTNLAELSKTSESKAALFLTALPFSTETWKLATERSDETRNLYWTYCPVSHPNFVNTSESTDAINRLLATERPLAAFHIISNSAFHNSFEELPSDLVLRVINEIQGADYSSIDKIHLDSSFEYHFQQIIKLIRKRSDIDSKQIAKIEWDYYNLFEHNEKPEALIKWMNDDPNFVAEVIELVYPEEEKSETPSKTPSEMERLRIKRGYSLLQEYNNIPGSNPDGTLNAEYLRNWTSNFRQACALKKRIKVGDHIVGRLLSNSPIDPDDSVWPHKAVRDILENQSNNRIEEGFLFGVVNSRGVVTKGYAEGGKQEKELAQKYGLWAEKCDGRWIRVARVLRRIERSYLNDAILEDVDAEKQLDLY